MWSCWWHTCMMLLACSSVLLSGTWRFRRTELLLTWNLPLRLNLTRSNNVQRSNVCVLVVRGWGLSRGRGLQPHRKLCLSLVKDVHFPEEPVLPESSSPALSGCVIQPTHQSSGGLTPLCRYYFQAKLFRWLLFSFFRFQAPVGHNEWRWEVRGPCWGGVSHNVLVRILFWIFTK